MRRRLSIVIPAYNEESGLPRLFDALERLIPRLRSEVEVIFIDNCSTDDTGLMLEGWVAAHPGSRYIRFSRNFGPSVEASLTAGFTESTGDATVVLYSDLQDPPELIIEFERLWLDEGYNVVYGLQKSRKGEPLWRRTSVKIFYSALNRYADYPVPADAGDFRLIDRRVRDILLSMDERVRYSRGLVAWIGFRQIGVPYEREGRASGRSKANVFAITRTAMTAITGFSLAPLRMLTTAGLALCGLSVVLLIGLAVMWIYGQPVPGLTTVIGLILLTSGLNFAAVGVMGEYVGRIHTEVKARPIYVVDVNRSNPRETGHFDPVPAVDQ